MDVLGSRESVCGDVRLEDDTVRTDLRAARLESSFAGGAASSAPSDRLAMLSECQQLHRAITATRFDNQLGLVLLN